MPPPTRQKRALLQLRSSQINGNWMVELYQPDEVGDEYRRRCNAVTQREEWDVLRCRERE